jgi:hypothetical protein
VLILLYVRFMYKRDAVELGRPWGWFLTILRSAAFFALLVLYLQPQWRTERETVINSRALLLVDTSLSMGLTDIDSPAAPGTSSPGTSSRAQQVAAALEQTDLLAQLRNRHDLVVLRFDENLESIASLDKIKPDKTGAGSDAPAEPDIPEAGPREDLEKDGEKKIDWREALAPSGAETRLGEALRQLVYDQRGAPVSGIIVVTDGGQNAGVAPQSAVAAAREARIPIFPVGIGSDQKPTNVRVSDLVVPARAYPGDQYTVTGFVQAQRMAGKMVTVQLLSRDADTGSHRAKPGTGSLLESLQVTLGGDGEVVPVKFELAPEETGRRTLCLRVQAPEMDRNPADNFREADIEIVDHKNRVLLFAGGPMREYRFLRTQLYRDDSTTVDVLLQSAPSGVSQESDELLDDFPATREDMYKYDCIVAFDPDWQDLDDTQIELLEGWVAEQGGGLIVIAGTVNMGNPIGGWIQDERMAKVRALYPVVFRRGFSMEEGSYAAKEPWPIEFTREGMEAEYIWLGDDAISSEDAWTIFPGVYGFFPVRGPKPGTTVLGRFSDPRSGSDKDESVLLATHFYGSGRVFYLGSAEMWRLRAVDETYFEQFYTKLIRYVSQGRLLRGSARGVLLVDRDRYLLGNTAEIRAQLTNAQLEPLDAPRIALHVIQPDDSTQTVTLQPDPARLGTFAGHFTVLQEGVYRLELPVPESDDIRLTRRIQVKLPELERENPERNDALLSTIAEKSGGKYYVGLEAALGADAVAPLIEQLKDRTKTIILTAAPNRLWEQTWLAWMMGVICGLLCLEWLIRRLLRLA